MPRVHFLRRGLRVGQPSGRRANREPERGLHLVVQVLAAVDGEERPEELGLATTRGVAAGVDVALRHSLWEVARATWKPRPSPGRCRTASS